MPPTTSPRQRRKDARPAELIAAALALFVEKGFAATRIEEVARRAGVSKGTLYLYFGSKEDLLKAVIREHVSREIVAGAEQLARYQGSAADLLQQVFTAWWLKTLDGPVAGVFKIIVTEVRHFPDIAELWTREVRQPATQLVGSLLQRGIDAGEFRRVDVPTAVHSLVLPMVMLCVHKHTLGACSQPPLDVDPRRFIEDHVRLLLHGIVAPAGPAAATRNDTP